MVRETKNNGNNGSDAETTTPFDAPKHPHVFARELAHMIEWSGGSVTDDQKATDDAKTILNLYLEGVVSLPLAVAYAERKTSHSAMLWEMLVSYCLGTTMTVQTKTGGPSSTSMDVTDDSDEEPDTNGVLFGSLLEVAARSGADLAHLIVCVPAEMRIKGIRPKLVAAISDYRLKLKIHEAVSDVFLADKVSLLRDQCHRARRGLRVDLPSDMRGVVVTRRKDVGGVEDDGDSTFGSREMLQGKRKQRQLLLLRKERTAGLHVRKSLTIR